MIEAISVSKLCGYIKNIFDSEELLKNIAVFGEVSNYSELRGNAYFNLKDDDSVMPCVYFGAFEKLNNGDKIIAVGSPNFYTKGGRLNFNVVKTTPYGIGELYKKFLELKNKLEKEGLFDENHKKPLPEKIRRIGVVSSESGAVIHDIIKVITRRNDEIDIVLYPARVQGIDADKEVISGIKFFENYDVDAIVVARGGGSFEDLNAFNSEELARCVFDCEKFIMSAVGHETDYTLIDFVSDMRAPTPSIAGELLSDLKSDKRKVLKEIYNRIEEIVFDKFEDLFDTLDDIKENFKQKASEFLREKEYEFALYAKTLEKSDINAILNKGFAYTLKEGKSISLKDLKVDDEFETVVKDGKIKGKVLKLEERWWIKI